MEASGAQRGDAPTPLLDPPKSLVQAMATGAMLTQSEHGDEAPRYRIRGVSSAGMTSAASMLAMNTRA